MVDEYIGSGEDRVKNRDGFTEVIGDMIFTIPAIKVANAHRGILFTQDYANLFQNIIEYLLSHTFNEQDIVHPCVYY